MKAEATRYATRSPQHTSIPGPDTVQRREYPNGMIVLVKENPTSPTVVIDGTLHFGSIDVPSERAGLAGFMTDTLMRGTHRRSFQQIYEEIESAGAAVDVAAGVNLASFSSKALAEDLPLMIDILADVLQNPAFPSAEVEKVRGEIMTDIDERAHDTRRMAALIFRELLYPERHPYAVSGLGYAETIDAISRDDLERFHHERVGAQGMITVIVGAVKAADAFRMWEEAFGNWRGATGPRPSMPPAPRLRKVHRKSLAVPGKTQSDMILGYVGPSRISPDFLPALLCNSILGTFGLNGRIGQKVRGRGGMAYYAYTRIEGGLGPGAWSAIAGVDPANVERTIKLIRGEVKRICDTKVSAQELADNKAFLTGSLPLRLETNEGVAALLGSIELYQLGLDHLQQYTQLVNAVTASEIQAAAQKYLDPDVYALSIAGPKAMASSAKSAKAR